MLIRVAAVAASVLLVIAITLQASSGARGTSGVVGALGVHIDAASSPGPAVQTGGGVPIGFRPGEIAPDFGLRDSTGRELWLNGFRGHPVIINFWASWCTYCRVEMPELDALYKDESIRHGLVVLTVDTLDSDRLAAEAFVIGKAFSFTILWDENNRVANLYDVRALPVSFFIDRDGIVREYSLGAMSRDDMREKAELIY